MADLTVQVSATDVLRMLKDGSKKQKYAIVIALNRTAKVVQRAEQQNVTAHFTVRKKQFVLRQAAIIRSSDWAKVETNKLNVRLSVGQKERFLLPGFEEGGPRPVAKGKRAAVPLVGGPARPTWGVSVPQSYLYKALRLRVGSRKGRVRRNVSVTEHTTKSGKTQYKGALRTFVLPSTNKAPEGGVFQRVGPGPGDIRMVYSFKPGLKLTARLGFVATALRVAPRRMTQELVRQIAASFKHAMRR